MMKRLMIFVVGAIVVALVVLAIWMRSRSKSAVRPLSKSQPGAQTNPAKETVLTEKQLIRDIVRQGLTAERAKLLFSMVVGPLPGVTIPEGARDATDFDGTLAIGYIDHVWASLTPEQRAAVSQLIDRSPRAASHAQPSSSNGYAPSFLPATYIFFNSAPAYDYQTMAQTANGLIAGSLNVSPVTFTIDIDYGTPPGTEYAHAWSWYRTRQDPEAPDLPYPTGCKISIWDQRMQTLDMLGAEAVVTHEMFHCFQQRVEGSAEITWSVHPWIREGQATWVMCDIVPGASIPKLDENWGKYTGAPTTLYSDRSYDAVGVYGHLGDLEGPSAVWPTLLPMVQVGTNGNDVGALSLLLLAHETEYYASWGSSYFREKGKIPWAIVGPGNPPDNSPSPQSVTVAAGTLEALAPAGPYLGEQFQLQASTEIVGVSLLTGYGRIHDGNFSLDTDLTPSAPLILCLKQGGCKCPDGSPGASMITKNAVAPISAGINGGDTTAVLGVAGLSLDDFCKKPDPDIPPPPPGPGGGGGGGGDGGDPPPKQPPPPPDGGQSFGDPHFYTFDGLSYDLQAVGEYTLARSTKDDFAVQVRQVPALGPKIASNNQAVAAKIGGQRVTFTLENRALVVRVDGKVITGELPKLRGGSLSSADTSFGSVYLLTWSDGTTLHVQQLGGTVVNVNVKPSASRKGTLVGLLGDFDGSQENDLVAGSVKLGTLPSPDDVNHKLADAWRVTQDNSLFDYAAGQSAKSFIDPSFPAKDAEAARMSNYAAAEAACRAHGITDQRLLQDCILDLAVTNNFLFGSQYAHAQQVLAAQAAIASPAVAVVDRKMWITGEILDSQSQPEFHFNGNQDDVIWIGKDPECVDSLNGGHPVSFWLIDPSGKKMEPFLHGCESGRIVLPSTGTYTAIAIFKYKDEVTRYRVPIRFVRHDRQQQISYGQSISGNIEQRPAHDVYTWWGQEGDLIIVSGQGCDLKGMSTVIYDPDGHDHLGPFCRVGNYFKLPKTGNYKMVVNGLDAAQDFGKYQFVFQGGKLTPPKE